MFILPLSLVIGKLNACFNYKNKKITITMENKNNFDLYDEENIEEEEEIENQMRDISLSGFKLTSNEKTLLNTSTSTLVPLPSTSNLEDPGNSTVIPNSTVVPLNKDRKIEHPNHFLIFLKKWKICQFELVLKEFLLYNFSTFRQLHSINPGISYVFALHQMTSLQIYFVGFRFQT